MIDVALLGDLFTIGIMNRIVTPSDTADAIKKPPESHGLLHEMIRSFTTLARTLNLSHAVRELGSTRQTVRRHIAQLEEAKGVELFTVEDRQYQLTEAGQRALPEALDLQARGNVWLRGQTSMNGRLQYLRQHNEGWSFYQQQQPLGELWSNSELLMRETFRAWAMAGGEIEHNCLSHVRPYLIIYRHTDAGWVCVEFGENSFYVKWFGLDFARSSVGRPISRMPAGEDFARILDQSFHEVESTQSARLDHVFTKMPRGSDAQLAPISYKRLMMGGRFPDRSPAVLSLILPSADVAIDGLENDWLDRVDRSVTVEFGREDARFETIVEGEIT